MTQPSSAPLPSSQARHHWRTILSVAIPLVIGAGLVVFLFTQRRGKQDAVVEVTVTGPEAASYDINRTEVINAVNRRDIKPREGYRYQVYIEDESDDGAAGVTHIGGMVTFIPGAEPGDLMIVEVTRIKERTANAVVVRRLETQDRPAAAERTARRPTGARRAEGDTKRLTVGQVYSGIVSDLGKKGDGIVRVEGKVVFIPGVKVGDKLSFRVTEDAGTIARGERVEAEAQAAATPAPAAAEVGAAAQASAPTSSAQTAQAPAAAGPADAVQPGAELEVQVTEKNNRNPEQDGVARVGGLVVFVPQSQPGDRVRIRIVERRPRSATAEVIERLP